MRRQLSMAMHGKFLALAAGPVLRRAAAGALLGCLLASAALAQAADPAATPQAAVNTGLPAAAPADVGLDAAALDKIPARIEEFVAAGQLSGAVTLVARKGRVAQLAAVGQADLASGRPMATDTLFAIASMTKPITATAVMILVDEGKLALDDPVEKYLPEFAAGKLASGEPSPPLLVRHLLTHTNGLARRPRTPGGPDLSLAERAAWMAQQPREFAPGAQWKYGDGLTVAGRIIEVITGQPFDAFLDARICGPLGMRDTTFNPTPAQRARLATLYETDQSTGKLAPVDNFIDPSDVPRPRVPNPSGGLYSTAGDLARFYQLILNGGELDGVRIVSRAAVAEMLRPQTGDLTAGFTPGSAWGLGWGLVQEPKGVAAPLSAGTYGHGGAFGTQGWVDPRREMILVLLIQRVGLPNSDGSAIRGAFTESAVGAVLP